MSWSYQLSGLTLTTELAGFWVHRRPIRESLTWLRTFLDIDPTRGGPDSLVREVGAGWVQRLRLESADAADVGELRRLRAAVAARRSSAGQRFHCTDHLVLALLRDGELAECASMVDNGIARALATDDS